jgi:hypothetical protein
MDLWDGWNISELFHWLEWLIEVYEQRKVKRDSSHDLWLSGTSKDISRCLTFEELFDLKTDSQCSKVGDGYLQESHHKQHHKTRSNDWMMNLCECFKSEWRKLKWPTKLTSNWWIHRVSEYWETGKDEIMDRSQNNLRKVSCLR